MTLAALDEGQHGGVDDRAVAGDEDDRGDRVCGVE
jgi:hypothetical protein